MAEISKITLPSGNTYDIKDATAREMISGGVSFVIAWDGTSVPTIANIPAGVVVKYNGTNYTGTLAADSAEVGAFYLIKSSTTPSSETLDIYDEYVPVGVTGSKTWEKIGDTQLNLTDVVTNVSGTTKYMAASASGGGAAWNSKDQVTALTGLGTPTTDTFVKSVSAETNKNLVTTTVPNVTDAGSASTWSFAMGTGTGNTETLIISGANSTAPTLGTAKTVATGTTSTTGTGDAVVTGVTIGSSAAAITAITPTTDTVIGSDATFTNTQPTISLSAEDATATGRASFVQSVNVTKGNA